MTAPAPAPPDGGMPRGVPRRWARPRRTVRLRLTLVYGGLFLLSGAGLLVITYVLVAHRLPVTATAHAGQGVPAGQAVPAPQGGQAVAAGQGEPAGMTVIYRGRGGCPALAGAAGAGGTLTPAQGQAVLGRCLSEQRAAELRELLTGSGIALAVMTVAAIGLGWLVAGRVLRPLRTITAAARRISARSLHQRLALAGPDDELKELGDTFDGLLARLDASFRAQRQFVGNASHELRTPLARQRTVMEVALADPQPTVASLRSACERVLAAGEQQEQLIEALLTLARSERGLDRREPFDLRQVTAEVLRARQPEAQVRGLGLDFAAAAAPAIGDARLADRLAANLVDNALRHNLPGGRVWVATAAGPGQAVLTVANTGPVIPAERVAELFQPFRRLAGDRPAAGEGLGLGLPIVAAIAAAHGAELRAAPRPAGGLTVEIRFFSPSDQGWGRPPAQRPGRPLAARSRR